jgi:hypothetical protein
MGWGKLLAAAFVFGAGSAVGGTIGMMVYDKLKAKLG